MSSILFFLLIAFLCNSTLPHSIDAEQHGKDDNDVHAGINKRESPSDVDASVLSPNVQVIIYSADIDSHSNASQQISTWEPSAADIQAAENLYKIKRETLKSDGLSNRTDYIDLNRTITPARRRNNAPNIVEVLIVCDYEWGNIFRHDRKRVLDYFTVYFYEVNMIYKSLRSSKISFQINGIVVIDSPAGQPFIEEARGSDGRADFNSILPKFGTWTWNRRSSLPKHDIAVAITATQLTWGGGLAYISVACARDGWNTGVWNDDGTWGSVGVAGHEISHNLGAPHDDDEDCVNRGFQSNGKSWAFSTCSDYKMAQFVNSEQASCLKTLEESRPTLSRSFSGVLPVSMTEQCRRRTRNRDASTSEDDPKSCETMGCYVPNPNGGGWVIWYHKPAENTACVGGGRCFRDRCRQPGSLLQNVGTGQCVIGSDPFAHTSPLELTACPDPIEGATPLDKFVIENTSSNGRYLMAPYSSPDNSENGDKCIYTGYQNGDWLWTHKCDLSNPWAGFDFRYVQGSWDFLLYHRSGGRCARAEGRNIPVYECSENDANMRWRLI